MARSDRFVSTMTEKLLTYALGRGLEHYDAPARCGRLRAKRPAASTVCPRSFSASRRVCRFR